MWCGARERGARCVAAFGEIPECGARDGGQAGRERADVRVLWMALCDVPEQHEARLARKRGRCGAMRVGRRDAFDGARQVRRNAAAGGACRCD
jgi:hypothetical protein